MLKQITSTIALLIFLIPLTGSAQIAIGGGFEVRSEEPTNGFNVRLEKGLKEPIPFLDLRARLQGGFFSGDITQEIPNSTSALEVDLGSYYVGANLIGEFKLPIPVNPYAGVGVGYESSTAEIPQATFGGVTVGGSENDTNSFYFEGTAGLKLSLIPVLKPFIEYRFVGPLGDYSFEDATNNASNTLSDPTANNRFVFGLLLEF